MKQSLRWRRTAHVTSDKTQAFRDDWTLVRGEKRLARIYDAGADDGGVCGGNWRYRVYRPDGSDYGGSALTSGTAKEIAERAALGPAGFRGLPLS